MHDQSDASMQEMLKLRDEVKVLGAKLESAQQDARDARSKAKHQNNELAAAQSALLDKKKVRFLCQG